MRQRCRGYVRRTRLQLPARSYDLVGARFVNEVTKQRIELPRWRRRGAVLIRHVREIIAGDLEIVRLSALLSPFNTRAALRTTVTFRGHVLTCERGSHNGLSTVQHVPRQRMRADACTVHAYMHNIHPTCRGADRSRVYHFRWWREGQGAQRAGINWAVSCSRLSDKQSKLWACFGLAISVRRYSLHLRVGCPRRGPIRAVSPSTALPPTKLICDDDRCPATTSPGNKRPATMQSSAGQTQGSTPDIDTTPRQPATGGPQYGGWSFPSWSLGSDRSKTEYSQVNLHAEVGFRDHEPEVKLIPSCRADIAKKSLSPCHLSSAYLIPTSSLQVAAP
jgi:hypothetical protein